MRDEYKHTKTDVYIQNGTKQMTFCLDMQWYFWDGAVTATVRMTLQYRNISI